MQHPHHSNRISELHKKDQIATQQRSVTVVGSLWWTRSEISALAWPAQFRPGCLAPNQIFVVEVGASCFSNSPCEWPDLEADGRAIEPYDAITPGVVGLRMMRGISAHAASALRH